MTRVFIVLLTLAVAGCATGPPPVYKSKAIAAANSADTATIFLNRQNGGALGFTVADIMLDGKSVGTIGNGQCVRLTVPAGSHNLQLSASAFGNFGSIVGNALAQLLKFYNVKIKRGQRQYFFAKAHYDGPKTGWLFYVEKRASGRSC